MRPVIKVVSRVLIARFGFAGCSRRGGFGSLLVGTIAAGGEERESHRSEDGACDRPDCWVHGRDLVVSAVDMLRRIPGRGQ